MDVLIKGDLDSPDLPVKSYVNIDSLVRFGPRPVGAQLYTCLYFADGSEVYVLDPVEEILHAVLKAEAKPEDKEK